VEDDLVLIVTDIATTATTHNMNTTGWALHKLHDILLLKTLQYIT